MTVQLPEFRLDEGAMREYCERRGATFLRVLQQARGGADACSGVFLALDADGIVKVFKEELPHKDSTLGTDDTEAAMHARLGALPHFPRLYGVESFGGISVLRQSVAYGQDLQAWIDAGTAFGPKQIRSIVGRVADALAAMHERRVIHQDIRPANVKIDGCRLSVIDVGDGRSITGADDVAATPSDPLFAAPETLTEGRASRASDVYQLGAVGELLLSNSSPFEDVDMTCCIGRMLDPNPAARPSAAEVARALGTERMRIPAPRGFRRTTMALDGTILFPARMGIPHQGHVDFIARVMELGFPVIISLQRSYTITDRDPLPKWQVMKMVAASLSDEGFVPDKDFTFVFTPFFDSEEAHKMHFAMMPGIHGVIAVASGNPSVHDLFPDLPFIDQRAVFGHEGEEYEERSWGEHLRTAVRQGDRTLFEAFAAYGVERILTLEELRRDYAKHPVEFVRGSVSVVALEQDGAEIARGRSFRYVSPQVSVVRHLQDAGHTTRVIDLYAKDTVIKVDGAERALRDAGTSVTADGNVEIRFTLV